MYIFHLLSSIIFPLTLWRQANFNYNLDKLTNDKIFYLEKYNNLKNKK